MCFARLAFSPRRLHLIVMHGELWLCSPITMAHQQCPHRTRQQWHASIWMCVSMCTHLVKSHGTTWHANTLHISLKSEPLVFQLAHAGPRRGGVVSRANTKGYYTHSTLNIKDSGNYSTLLSGSSCMVGCAIHLTLEMVENGWSGWWRGSFGMDVLVELRCG